MRTASLARCLALPGILVAALASGCLTGDDNLDDSTGGVTPEPEIDPFDPFDPCVPGPCDPDRPPPADDEVPPADSVTLAELPDVSPPETTFGSRDSHLFITSHLQITDGVRIRIDGKYLVYRTAERAYYVNLNAYEVAPDFGMGMQLPPGYKTVELVTVTGQVVATHTAPPRTAIDDHIKPQFVAWGTPDHVKSHSIFAEATDRDPATYELSIDNTLDTPVTVELCDERCVPVAEVAPHSTFRTSAPMMPVGSSGGPSFRAVSSDGIVAHFTTSWRPGCQLGHAFFYPDAYGPGPWEGEYGVIQDCIGR